MGCPHHANIFAFRNPEEYKSRKVGKKKQEQVGMIEHTWEGKSTQQDNRGYFGKEKHKPWKRIKSRLKQPNGK